MAVAVEDHDQFGGAVHGLHGVRGHGGELGRLALLHNDLALAEPETDATFEQREEWLRAWCAEKTGIVDVLKVWDLPCPMCRPDDDAAVDPEPSPGAPGCRGCGGGGIVRKVRYR